MAGKVKTKIETQVAKMPCDHFKFQIKVTYGDGTVHLLSDQKCYDTFETAKAIGIGHEKRIWATITGPEARSAVMMQEIETIH